MKISRIITSLFALFSATKNPDNNDNFTGLVNGSGGGSIQIVIQRNSIYAVVARIFWQINFPEKVLIRMN